MGDDKRMNHDAMRAAFERPIHGVSHEPIPGEFDPTTEEVLPHPMGSELIAPDIDETLAPEERREREREGGGAPSQRRPKGGHR